eukprot:jgi/Tetstr1/420902/TSEL_011965.t1
MATLRTPDYYPTQDRVDALYLLDAAHRTLEALGDADGARLTYLRHFKAKKALTTRSNCKSPSNSPTPESSTPPSLLARQAKQQPHRPARDDRWLPMRELQSLARRAQYMYLAIPAARFYLRGLRDVVGSMWLETRGFWGEADERQHITWKEQKAVRLAVESFLPHLAARRLLLHEDNQADLRGTVKAASLQPHLSAINGFYRDRDEEPVAQGDLSNKHPRILLFRAALAVVAMYVFYAYVYVARPA